MARYLPTWHRRLIPGLLLPLGLVQLQPGSHHLVHWVPGPLGAPGQWLHFPPVLLLPPVAQLPCAHRYHAAYTQAHAAMEGTVPSARPHRPQAARRDGPVLHVPDWEAFVQHYPELSDLTITAFLEEFRHFLEREANGACPLDPALQLRGVEDTPVSTHGHSSSAEVLHQIPQVSEAEHICTVQMDEDSDASHHGLNSPDSADCFTQAPDLLQHWVHIRRSKRCSETPMLWDTDPFWGALASPLQDTEQEQARASADLPPWPPLSPSGTAEESSLHSSAHSCQDSAEPQRDGPDQGPRNEPLAAPMEDPLLSPRWQPRVLLTRLQLPLGLGSCQGMPTRPEVGSSPAKRPVPARTRRQRDSSQQDHSPPRKRRKMELRQLRKR